jgi:hypothetical protein
MGSWNLLENLARTLQNIFSPGGFHKAIYMGITGFRSLLNYCISGLSNPFNTVKN